MKHAYVSETLIFGAHGAESASALGAHAAECGPGGSPCSRDAAHPFTLAEPDPDPLPAVTRLQCEIEGARIIDEWDARAWLAERARQAAQRHEPRANARTDGIAGGLRAHAEARPAREAIA